MHPEAAIGVTERCERPGLTCGSEVIDRDEGSLIERFGKRIDDINGAVHDGEEQVAIDQNRARGGDMAPTGALRAFVGRDVDAA